MPEEQIIENARKGDKDAFGEIYKIYLDRIYRFVYFLVRDEPLAEDITQNVFIKAWMKIGEFSLKRGTMQAFLFAIARNLVIDEQRKKKALPLDGEAENFIPSGENLEEKVIRSETNEQLMKFLNRLPETDKQIVIMKYFEDMEYQEIAGVVKKNVVAVRVRLFRALKTVREFLEKGAK